MGSGSLRVPVDGLVEGLSMLPKDASKYVVRVHRMKSGDPLLLFDPRRAVQAEARLTDDRLPQVGVELGPVVLAPRSEMPVTLLQAVGKADKPEQAVKDATAFGAEGVVLVHGARSVARSEGAQRRDRLERVAEQVARQCGRGNLPKIVGPRALHDVLLQLEEHALNLACVWHERAVPLVSSVRNFDFGGDVRLNVLVGPEGGLDPSEVAAAIASGFQPVSLGPYVLRAETAAGSVLSTLRALHVAGAEEAHDPVR